MNNDSLTTRLKHIPPVIWINLILVVLWLIFSPGFFSFGNLYNLGAQAAPLLILAIAETIVILSEGIDLSVGYVLSIAGVAAAYMMKVNVPLPLVLLGAVAVGGVCGYLNGMLVAKGGLPPFIATLGVGSMAFGLGLIVTEGLSVPAFKSSFRFIADGKILGLSVPIVIAILVFLGLSLLMRRTSFGRNVHGLGGNAEALRLAGVNITRAQIMVYTVSGLLCGIAGIIVAARTASGHAGAGLGWDFDAIAATIIGGSSFEEGRGSINKTILGVILISILRNGLNIAGVPNMYQFALIGVVVLGAIIIDVLFTKKMES
jgi:ribose transport system permease protein